MYINCYILIVQFRKIENRLNGELITLTENLNHKILLRNDMILDDPATQKPTPRSIK